MRGDALLTARLLLRRDGIAGVVIAAGGATAVYAAAQPWYLAMAEVAMLGAEQARAVGAVRGVPGTAPGWAVLALGVAAFALGLACAFDRPPAWTRRVLVAATVGLVAAAVYGWFGPLPELADVAGREGHELLDLAERLPSGIAVELRVTTGSGPWVAIMSSLLVSGGAFAAREM